MFLRMIVESKFMINKTNDWYTTVPLKEREIPYSDCP